MNPQKCISTSGLILYLICLLLGHQVYRILENPVLRPNRKKGHTLTLSELNREGCFKAVYPIHSGDFELEDGKDWNKIDVNGKI